MTTNIQLKPPLAIIMAALGVHSATLHPYTLVARWQPLAMGPKPAKEWRRWRPSDPPRASRSMFPRVNASMDTATVDCTTARDLSNVLSLNNIRQTLIRLEDTIIFGLIERAQFARNSAVYEEPGVEVPGCSRPGCSLLEYILRETEQIHGRIRRYTSPDENAYFPEALPSLLLPPITYEQVNACRAWEIPGARMAVRRSAHLCCQCRMVSRRRSQPRSKAQTHTARHPRFWLLVLHPSTSMNPSSSCTLSTSCRRSPSLVMMATMVQLPCMMS